MSLCCVFYVLLFIFYIYLLFPGILFSLKWKDNRPADGAFTNLLLLWQGVTAFKTNALLSLHKYDWLVFYLAMSLMYKIIEIVIYQSELCDQKMCWLLYLSWSVSVMIILQISVPAWGFWPFLFFFYFLQTRVWLLSALSCSTSQETTASPSVCLNLCYSPLV